MNDNTTKQRDNGCEEYGKVRCPKDVDDTKTEFGKVRESREQRSMDSKRMTAVQPTPRPAVTAQASPQPIRASAAYSRRPRSRVQIPLPWIFGALGALAAVMLIIFAVRFWGFGEWVFGIMTAAALVAIAVWIHNAFDGYVPTIRIGFSLAILNVILFFILREDYDIMAMLISLGLTVMFFLSVLYAYDDLEEGYGCFSGVLMSAVLLFATAVTGSVTLFWFFACWIPGVLISLIIACLMMEVDGVYIFGFDLPDGCLQAVIITVVTLLMHFLFEVVSPAVIELFTK